MATGAEILKEYLVKLGFEVDNTAQSKIRQSIKELESQLTQLSKNKTTAALIKGMAGYATAIAAVVTATVGLMHKVAETDLEYEKLALNMNMTKDAAKQLTIAQQALGASIEEIVWNPELRKHYHELRRLVAESAVPPEAQESFKQIREIGFEFTKLKVIIKSASEWIVHHLAKNFGKSMADFKKWMQDVNKWLKENIAKWTKWIADFITRIVGVVKVIWGVFTGFVSVIKQVNDILPTAAKAVIAFIAVVTGALRVNPIFAMLTAVFLLLEDYWTFIEAKKNGKEAIVLFKPLWESLEKVKESLGGPFERMLESLKRLFGMSPTITFWDKFASVMKSLARDVERVAGGLMVITGMVGGVSGGIADMGSAYQRYKERQKDVEKITDPTKKTTAASKNTAQFFKEFFGTTPEGEAGLEQVKKDIGMGLWMLIHGELPPGEEGAATDIQSRYKKPVPSSKPIPTVSTAPVKPDSKGNYPAWVPQEYATAGGGNNFYDITIGSVVLPNVKDADQFAKALMSKATLAVK